MRTAAAIKPLPALPLGTGSTLGWGLHLFDRQVDPVGLVNANDLHFDFLSLVEVIRHLIYIGIGDLRNMYQPGLSVRQGYKSPEFCDTRNLAVNDGPNSKLHKRPKYPPCKIPRQSTHISPTGDTVSQLATSTYSSSP